MRTWEIVANLSQIDSILQKEFPEEHGEKWGEAIAEATEIVQDWAGKHPRD